MKAIARIYVMIEKLIPALFFVSIFAVMLLEIFSRQLFGKSFPWNTEYCRYALVWVTFLGCVYVRRENSHIKVEALYDFFKRRNAWGVMFLMDAFQHLLALVFWIFLAYYGGRLSYRVTRIISPALEVSLFWLYLPTCICGVLGTILEVGGLIKTIAKATTGNGYRGDSAPVDTSDAKGGL